MSLIINQVPVCNELIYYIATFLYGLNLCQFAQTCKNAHEILKETKIYKKALEIVQLPSKILHMKTFVKNFQATNSEVIKDLSELKLPTSKIESEGGIRFIIKEEFKVGGSVKAFTKECTSDLNANEEIFSKKLATFIGKLQKVKPEEEKVLISIFLKKSSSDETTESIGTLEKIYRLFKRLNLFINAYRQILN